MTKRVALVTGGNKGIGLEVVRQLSQAGMQVVLGARSMERGTAAAQQLQEKGLDVVFLHLDVCDPQSIAAAAQCSVPSMSAHARAGRIHLRLDDRRRDR